jgi:tetratricopeptide (TPR) repeat protein
MQNNICEKQGDKKNLAITLGNMATQQLVIGALGEAERNLRRGIDICREIEDKYWESVNRKELVPVLVHMGSWEFAEKEFEQAVNIPKNISHAQHEGVAWAYRAQRFLLMARDNPKSQIANLKSSIECAQRALELADEDARTDAPTPRDYVRAHWLLGAAYRMNNDLTLAEENLSKALNLCRQINMVDHEADILLDLARLRYASHKNGGTSQDDLKDAQEKASEALMITERCGYVLQGADVNLFLAELALTRPFGAPSPDFGRGESEHSEDGVRALARKYAEEAKRLATCDGPPYYYKVAYEEAERLLARLQG